MSLQELLFYLFSLPLGNVLSRVGVSSKASGLVSTHSHTLPHYQYTNTYINTHKASCCQLTVDAPRHLLSNNCTFHSFSKDPNLKALIPPTFLVICLLLSPMLLYTYNSRMIIFIASFFGNIIELLPPFLALTITSLIECI